MKTKQLLLALLFPFLSAYGLDTNITSSKITDVTVFLSGAQVTRTIKLDAPKGKQMIIIEKLPRELNPQSIQVHRVEGCKILSVKHQLDLPNTGVKSAKEKEIIRKIEAYELQLQEITNKQNVFEIEERILLDNSTLRTPAQGSAIAEIKAAADFYRLRLNEIRENRLKLTVDMDNINTEIQELYSSMNMLSTEKRKAYSKILVVLDCEKELKKDLKFSYYVSSAGWTPLYDFRVEDISKPLVIVYNANVYQSSGEDWTNVNIILSNSNPTLSGSKPSLKSWNLESRNSYQTTQIQRDPGTLKGRVFDKETGEPIPFSNVMVLSGNNTIGGTSTDFDGNYTIKPIPQGNVNVKASCVGYKPLKVNNLKIHSDKTSFYDFNMQSTEVELMAFEVVEYAVPLISMDKTSTGATFSANEIHRMPNSGGGGYYTSGNRGQRSSGEAIYIDGIQVNGSQSYNHISYSLKTSVATMEYVIDIPYNIPSDGEDHHIKIKEVSLPVIYTYHAVPKLDNDVFLTADIPDWASLNLLSGKYSIYYQGTYTSESYINAAQTQDTLSVSLGRDKSIVVTREGNSKLIDRKMLGKTVKDIMGWNIVIKNNKTSTIKLIIEDQYPVSNRKSVEVELLESSGAIANSKTGSLRWEFALKAGEMKSLNFQFSVKYPVGTAVSTH